MDLHKICEDLISMCITEFNKEKNKSRVKEHILDPCVKYLVDQFYPYIIATCIIFILTFLLAIAILTVLLKNNQFSMLSVS